jgi:hypothetical protein
LLSGRCRRFPPLLGSSRAAISVEPTRSQNSTVRCRRSPPAKGVAVALTSVVAGAAAIRAVPHESQNRAPARASVPHDGHCASICAPQPSQNLAVSRLSAPHFEQRIYSPLRLRAPLDEGEPQAHRDRRCRSRSPADDASGLIYHASGVGTTCAV